VYAELRIDLNQKMNVVRHHLHFDQFTSSIVGDVLQDGFQSFVNPFNQNFPPIFRTPDDVVLARIDHVSVASVLHAYHYIGLDYIIANGFLEKSVPFIPIAKARGFLGFLVSRHDEVSQFVPAGLVVFFQRLDHFVFSHAKR